MSRLADYFAVIGYDHKKDRNGLGCGKVIQRFPVKDWPDSPFVNELELFCQPHGWVLSTERQEPRFFVSVLTDINSNRRYCSVLCFNESSSITPSKPTDEEDDVHIIGTHHSIIYAPKCLVLISSLDYFNTFRDCLGIIYTVCMEGLGVCMETLIGNLIGYVFVPPPGGPQVRFSIGAGDSQALQPPVSPTIPVTHSSLCSLFQQLGIRNVLILFCAALTEHKILFYSRSYCHLTNACQGLKALIYPLKYDHVYIPIIPTSLTEVLSAPTPFIMGCHSSIESEATELMDVIVADLDGGCIRVPDSLTLENLPDLYLKNIHNSLSMVLHPELLVADTAFSSNLPPRPSSPLNLDKELRAIFMRMFAELLQGYRSCLTIIRIHPMPVITFHKAAFLSQRGLSDNRFLTRLLDSMFFTTFVSERGPPWRVCDLWDDLYAVIADQLKQEQQDSRLIIEHIYELRAQLLHNEYPNSQHFVPKIPKPTEGSFTRIHQPIFPKIDEDKVQAIIDEGASKRVKFPQKPEQLRIVPTGPLTSSVQQGGLVSSSARRLEVMRNCVNCIFESKISDARKTFPAVLRALKSKAARLALCAELGQHVSGNRAVLEHQQFDLVVRLMNCALQDSSPLDEYDVAAALLPLSAAFCRKLCTGVIQFAYTCIQDHPVWSSQQFWEAAFYQSVQRDIKGLYLSRYNHIRQARNHLQIGMDRHRIHEKSSTYLNQQEPSALEITAEQMRLWSSYDKSKQMKIEEEEESTLYAQAVHFAIQMVCLRVPLDINSTPYKRTAYDRDNMSASITNSMAESDSMDAESGFGDQEANDNEQSVIKFVSRFVDKVCTEGGVTPEHIKSLHRMIPVEVALHIESLDSVYKESKRLPPIQKPKIPLPSLVPGEEILYEGLRVYLVPDGREEGLGGQIGGGPSLLPASGALFVTSYRLIFKGQPTDPLACEHVIVRSVPIASITKEKRVAGNHHPGPINLDQFTEGLQVRSNTFQLIRVAFDEEVSSESIEGMRKLINRLRHPQNIQQLFAFSGQYHVPQTPSRREKDKPGYGTLRGFAKTLMKTAKVPGLKAGKANKRHKYVFPNSSSKTLAPPPSMNLAHMNNIGLSNSNEDLPMDDDLSVVDELEVSSISNGSSSHLPMTTLVGREMDGKALEKLTERSYYKDYQRLGLGILHFGTTGVTANNTHIKGEFRVSSCNWNYHLCRSYPALISVPSGISDESLHRLSRLYHNYRLPVITWRQYKSKALLLRGAALHSKGVMSMLKGPPAGSGAVSETSHSVEQEKFLVAIASSTPMLGRDPSSLGLSDSSLSLNSLVQAAGGNITALELSGHYHPTYPTLTPEIGRKANAISKAMNTLRNRGVSGASAGAGGGGFPRWGSLKGLRSFHGSPSAVPHMGGGGGLLEGSAYMARGRSATLHSYRRQPPPPSTTIGLTSSLSNSTRLSLDISESSSDPMQSPNMASLYILVDRTHIKGIKVESFPKTEFIPVEYPEVRQIKSSFKKLMRACIPSSASAEQEQPFYRAIENSEWLQHLSTLLKYSSNVVNLINMLGVSVMLLLEEGWDFTAQLSSLSQLCLDPYYRTIEGFRVLMEKEWLAFGHRFLHRSNLLQGGQASGFAPYFLQFLDAVHQIQRQFPLSFEFNEYYLRFLAYHSTSARFRTFLTDCELERTEIGIMTEEDKRGSLSRHHKGLEATQVDGIFPTGNRIASSGNSMYLGQSVFDYIEKMSARSSVFRNFLYVHDRNTEMEVLVPKFEVSALTLWSYLMGEDLRHGPSYDPEVRNLDLQQEEEAEAADGTTIVSRKKIIINGYDCISATQQNIFTSLLEDLRHLESELGLLPKMWMMHWDCLDLPAPDHVTRQNSMKTQIMRQHGKAICKRSTLEFLVRAKVTSGTVSETTQNCYSHPHRFEKYNYTSPSQCDYCSSMLWGPIKTGMKCSECGYNSHEKCTEYVPKNCPQYKSTRDFIGNSQNTAKPPSLDTTSVGSGVTSHHTASKEYYEGFTSVVPENRSHAGYLWKRGALLKNWKQRWFVLDTIKHQLRYYDCNEEDANSKKVIELSDVNFVVSSTPGPGAPKKVDDKAFFDLQTKRRLYNFCASDATLAQEWIEKIQSCL